jgi:hypothetical protein
MHRSHDLARGDASHHCTCRDVACNDSSCCHYAPVPKFYTAEDHSTCSDPATVTDPYKTDIHGRVCDPDVREHNVVRISDINARTEHIVVANFDPATCVDHDVTIEKISVPNLDSNIGGIGIVWVQPASG